MPKECLICGHPTGVGYVDDELCASCEESQRRQESLEWPIFEISFSSNPSKFTHEECVLVLLKAYLQGEVVEVNYLHFGRIKTFLDSGDCIRVLTEEGKVVENISFPLLKNLTSIAEQLSDKEVEILIEKTGG